MILVEDYELLQSTSFLAAADSHPVIGLIPDLLLHMTEDGCIIGYQKPRQMTLPLAPQDFLGKQLADIFPADIAEKALEKIKKLYLLKMLKIFIMIHIFMRKRNILRRASSATAPGMYS